LVSFKVNAKNCFHVSTIYHIVITIIVDEWYYMFLIFSRL